MRVDRFLFFVRLAKSRTLAQTAIIAGHVRIDGKRTEKPSREVHVGSVIALSRQGKLQILRVLGLPGRRGPAAEARACYEELGIDEPKPAT